MQNEQGTWQRPGRSHKASRSTSNLAQILLLAPNRCSCTLFVLASLLFLGIGPLVGTLSVEPAQSKIDLEIAKPLPHVRAKLFVAWDDTCPKSQLLSGAVAWFTTSVSVTFRLRKAMQTFDKVAAQRTVDWKVVQQGTDGRYLLLCNNCCFSIHLRDHSQNWVWELGITALRAVLLHLLKFSIKKQKLFIGFLRH